jgi:hypothetical protein
MMPGRIGVKKLIVERVRDPRQRMPVRLLGGRECPVDRFPAESRMNVRIVGDVSGIVVVDEGMLVNGVIER